MSAPFIDAFLAHMVEKGASDLHFSTGKLPSLRINGRLLAMDYPSVLTEMNIRGMLEQIADDKVQKRISEGETLTFAYQVSDPRARFRINVFPEMRGLAVAIRHIPSTAPRLSSLGLPPIVPQFTGGNHGIVVVCGSTGSGKSTTLAACVNEINHTSDVHVITLEDPIEYIFQGERALIHQREIGRHAPSFNAGLIEALRQDPDVIVVGEVRGTEEVRRALQAAETGHLVLTTVHASSAEKAVSRLISIFPPDEQEMVRTVLAETLRVVIAQKLVVNKEGDGRVAALEIMTRTAAIAAHIREDKTHQIYGTIQSSSKQGMITMNESLARLVRGGVISREAAGEASNDVVELHRLLTGLR